MKVQWSLFKQFVDNKSLSIQWLDLDKIYSLKAFDGSFSLECELDKYPTDTTDLSDFENNYKSNGNKPLWQYDTDGAQIVRIKAAKKGWSFAAVPVEITTASLLGSLFCKDAAGVDISGISCKIYNNSDVEITTAGLANANLLTCTKTVLDVELPYDFELIGGDLRINSNPGSDIRLWIVGAPDIPAQYGGSKEFASGINLKFLAPDASFTIDGRVTKYITYSAVTHSGKMRFILKHPAGTQINLQFVIHMYRL